MAQESFTKLEELISGNMNSVEIEISSEVTRESILEELNNLILSFFPRCWTKGEFINKDSNYLTYELRLAGLEHNEFTGIRILDFGNKFRLIRV